MQLKLQAGRRQRTITVPQLQQAERKRLQIITRALVLAEQAPGGCVVWRALELLVVASGLFGGGRPGQTCAVGSGGGAVWEMSAMF